MVGVEDLEFVLWGCVNFESCTTRELVFIGKCWQVFWPKNSPAPFCGGVSDVGLISPPFFWRLILVSAPDCRFRLRPKTLRLILVSVPDCRFRLRGDMRRRRLKSPSPRTLVALRSQAVSGLFLKVAGTNQLHKHGLFRCMIPGFVLIGDATPAGTTCGGFLEALAPFPSRPTLLAQLCEMR